MAPYNRGVRANVPNKPRIFHRKFWNRELPTHLMSLLGSLSRNLLAAEKARRLLNQMAGEIVYFTDTRYIPQLSRVGTHGFMYLPGGCAWALNKHHGCSFCPFQQAVDEYVGDLPIGEQEFLSIFQAGFATMRESVDIINIFTAGSFLNPGEIPQDAQLEMIRRVGEQSQAQTVRIESRLPYITPELVGPLVDNLATNRKTLDIAIGFETENDHVRNKLMHKGIGKRSFEKSVRLVKDLGGRVSVYLMLKPHLVMGEGYALDQCIESISYVFGAGVDEVLLQALYISPGTPQMVAWNRENGFRPPWLWTIIEVLKQTAHLGPVMLGRWDDEIPRPIDWPRNCGHCDHRLLSQITAWRQTLNPGVFGNGYTITCDCQTDWEHDLLHSRDFPLNPKT
ncbi:hypothetical protein KJ611_03580 [Patescibacteria group bacterium]|nr:hypothetical protein [Patescibacteria group bacterium]